MTTTSPSTITLLSATPTGTAAHMRIDLAFNTAMARGTGKIYVTDGAVQTVIDRVTGLPTLRIVGATVTREIAGADLAIDGTHVKLDVSGLQGGHDYSVVMDAGALLTAANQPFAGVRTPGQVAFTAPATLAVASVELDNSTLSIGHNLELTITFSQAVSNLDPAALSTPGALLLGEPRKVGDGTVWHVTLAGADATNADSNVVGINLNMVRDLAGNPGSGTYTSTAHYAVDTVPPAAPAIELDGTTLSGANTIGITLRFAEAVALDGSELTAPHATLANLHSIDGGHTWLATLSASDAAASSGNVLSLDMSKVTDLAGNAGTGTVSSPNYAVEPVIGAVLGQHIDINDLGADPGDHITSAAARHLGGDFTGPLAAGQHIKLTIDDVAVGSDEIHIETNGATSLQGWYYQGSGDFADGVHNIKAWIEDDNGNTSPVVSQAITIDTTAPALASGAGDTPFDVTHPLVITFSEPVYWGSDGADHQVIRLANLNDNSVREIYVDDRNLSADRKTLTISADDLHLLGAIDYRVTLPTTIIDLAGNELGENEIAFHTQGDYADLTGPRALRADAGIDGSSTGSSFGAGTVITIRVRFSEPVQLASGAAPTLGLDNGATAGSATISSDKLEVSFRYTVADGDLDTAQLAITDTSALVGRIADLAGNLLTGADIGYLGLAGSDGPISIDTHAPAALATATLAESSDTGISGSDGITNISTPTLTGGGAEANALDIRIYEGANAIGHGYSNADGTWSATIDSGAWLPDGSHTLVVKQVDQAGHESAASPAVTVTIDTTPPLPLAAPLADNGVIDGTTNDRTPTFTGSGAAANSIIKLYASANGHQFEYGHTVSGADGTWSITTDALDDGSYNISVKQFDVAGNTNQASPAVALTIDTTPPAAPPAPVMDADSDKGVSSSDGITDINTPTFTGAGALPNSVVKLYANEHEVGNTVSDAQGNWRITTSVLGDDSYRIGVKQFDVAGNESDYSNLIDVTIDTVPPHIVGVDFDHLGASVELTFSEDIVFAASGRFSLADADGHEVDTFIGTDSTWQISHSGTVLELDGLGVSGIFGRLHLANAHGSLQDVAGNVALIGSAGTFDIPQL